MQVSTWYTVIIFTASLPEYADPVIDWLDGGDGGGGMVGGRLFRSVRCFLLPIFAAGQIGQYLFRLENPDVILFENNRTVDTRTVPMSKIYLWLMPICQEYA